MNIAFYISGNGTRLSNLFRKNSAIISQTKLIITDSKTTDQICVLAGHKNIAFEEFAYKQNSNKDENLRLSEFILKHFIAKKIDYCFCFGTHLLKGELLALYRNKIINFHPSILPMFPGLNAIDQALNDDKTILLGNTAHFIEKGIDTGPIIIQTAVPKSYFSKNGYNGILDLQIDMIELVFDCILNNTLKVKKGQVFLQIINNNPKLLFNNY